MKKYIEHHHLISFTDHYFYQNQSLTAQPTFHKSIYLKHTFLAFVIIHCIRTYCKFISYSQGFLVVGSSSELNDCEGMETTFRLPSRFYVPMRRSTIRKGIERELLTKFITQKVLNYVNKILCSEKMYELNLIFRTMLYVEMKGWQGCMYRQTHIPFEVFYSLPCQKTITNLQKQIS